MDYAIGDIHGCLDKTRRLLDLVGYDPAADRLIFVGDYIDRGPDSKGVLDLMLRLHGENPANIFLLGNHEDNFLRYVQACLTGERHYWLTEPFLAGGGLATLASYHPRLHDLYEPHVIEAIPEDHLAFLLKLPLYWTNETYIAVHAGVRPGVPLELQNEHDLLRIRGPFLDNPHGLRKYVIFGHTPFRVVQRQADKVGIDTGACYQGLGYGKLTAFCLQTQQTFQVE